MDLAATGMVAAENLVELVEVSRIAFGDSVSLALGMASDGQLRCAYCDALAVARRD